MLLRKWRVEIFAWNQKWMRYANQSPPSQSLEPRIMERCSPTKNWSETEILEDALLNLWTSENRALSRKSPIELLLERWGRIKLNESFERMLEEESARQERWTINRTSSELKDKVLQRRRDFKRGVFIILMWEKYSVKHSLLSK